jgi:hypothetical protein
MPHSQGAEPLQEKPWTISVGAQYDFEIVQHNSFARVDWADQSGFRGLLPQNDPTTSSYTPDAKVITSSSYFNVRLGTNIGHAQVSAFGNNIFNAHPMLSGYTNGGQQYFEDVTLQPRTIGVTAELRY